MRWSEEITKQLAYCLTLLGVFISTFYVPVYVVDLLLLGLCIPLFWQAIKSAFKGIIGSDLFLSIATIVGLIGHEERAICIVLLIMALAEYIEYFIEERTTTAIESLVQLIPTDVRASIKGKEQRIPLASAHAGMIIIVYTGDRIPVDGSVTRGTAFVNESSLTGESTQKRKTIGDIVFAGTFIEEGSIEVEVEKVGTQTFFGKIQQLLENTQTGKSRIALLADRVAFILVPMLLLFIGLVWLYTGNIQLIVSLLVFGSPLELTLVTPLASLAGVTAAFKQGILVKGGKALERLAHIDTIIFDKTGTLTCGMPQIVRIDVIDAHYTQQDILLLAAIAEKHSGHVLARAILQKAHESGIVIPEPEHYSSKAGQGVEVIYKSKKYRLGSKHFIEQVVSVQEHDEKAEDSTTSVVYLTCQDYLCGRIYIADLVRDDASSTIRKLHESGLDVLLLSGDRHGAVEYTATTLGIKKYYSGLFPDEKLALIKKLQTHGHIVAMVGDGINDAPALKQADLGIALGGMGMEPAIEAADIVLLTNDLEAIYFVYTLAKKVLRTIKQNIFFGFILVHAVGMLLAFLGIISPVQAAIFHAVPDIAMVLNSLRLTTTKKVF
ncbi:cation-translocating P-type ATPase [Candidatus Dependentiae bacterium]|nr:cation-translocating P-type ATPase [Candidatus Dependentiae bacterium]